MRTPFHFHSTPSHGGFRVPEQIAKRRIPEYILGNVAEYDELQQCYWFEEDCAACIVMLFFDEFFEDTELQNAKRTFANYYWRLYEIYYGVTLDTGESYSKDRETHRETHYDDYVTATAYGSWHDKCPDGFVILRTIRASTQDEKYFLVPREDYRKYQRRTRTGFVIDLDKHREIDFTDTRVDTR
jgi:hypothetical protein